MEFPIWVKNSQYHWKQWNSMHSNAFGFGIEDNICVYEDMLNEKIDEKMFRNVFN